MTGKTIDTKIGKSIKNLSKQFENCQRVKEFEDSVEEFEQLVKRGVAKKRGNNLLSTTDAHLKNIHGNTARNASINSTREHARFLDVDATHYRARNW